MQKTLVTFLLDRSGSMDAIKDDTIGGFNAFLQGLQNGDAADDTEFSFVQFDSSAIDKVYVNKPVKDAPNLTRDTFQPRDCTPLIDAAYKTIKAVEVVVQGSDKKVVIAIQTDGQENASTDHTWDELTALVKEKTALGWQFNFLGVGIDAYNQAAMMGIGRGSTVSASMDPVQMKAAYAASASNAALYASGAVRNTMYSAEQKFAAGDAYDPDINKLTIDLKNAVKVPQASPWAQTVHPKAAPKPRKGTKPSIVDDIDLTK